MQYDIRYKAKDSPEPDQNSNLSVQSTYQKPESADEFVGIVFEADYQHHLINKTSPIQSVTFDKRIDVSVRPQALTLASTILQREANERIEEDFEGYERFHLGDVLDTSNLAEWVMYLASVTDGQALREVFDLEDDAVYWDEDEWRKHFSTLDDKTWDDYLIDLSAFLEEHPEYAVLAGPEGNHDGAAWGNGLNHARSLVVLDARHAHHSRRKKRLERRINRIQGILDNRKMMKPRRERLEDKLERLERRLEYVIEKIKLTEEERREVKRRKSKNNIKKVVFKIPRVLSNNVMGLKVGQNINHHRGYWAQNSGTYENNIDKGDYVLNYLKVRYPELDLTCLDEPLVTKVFFNTLDKDKKTTDYQVENIERDEETGEFLKNRDGSYKVARSRSSILESQIPSAIEENFHNFWKEVKPGEYISLIKYPFRDSEIPNQNYIMLQAFEVGEVNGKKVFNIMLDGMDHTEQEVELAFWGAMSKLQRQVVQSFLDYQRLQYNDETLFMHSSHYPLDDHVKQLWRKYGWQDYFSQEDVVPFLFCGHGHTRKMIDESKVKILGTNLRIGFKPVDREEGFFSVMVPSVTDGPNEFMSVKLEYDEEKQEYILGNTYHDVVNVEDVSDRVVQDVANLKTYYEKNHYHNYARMRTGLLASAINVFFKPDKILAYDSIPLAVEQFEEAMIYSKYFVDLLRDEFGEGNAFFKIARKTHEDMYDHFQRWFYGDPSSEDDYDKIGYFEAQEKSKKMRRYQDRMALMVNYNDVFDTPAYDRFRLLISQIPKESMAYDFWLLLGKKAAEEESRESNKRKKRRHSVPNTSMWSF